MVEATGSFDGSTGDVSHWVKTISLIGESPVRIPATTSSSVAPEKSPSVSSDRVAVCASGEEGAQNVT